MFALPQIVYNELDMFDLAWSESGYIKHLWGEIGRAHV